MITVLNGIHIKSPRYDRVIISHAVGIQFLYFLAELTGITLLNDWENLFHRKLFGSYFITSKKQQIRILCDDQLSYATLIEIG